MFSIAKWIIAIIILVFGFVLFAVLIGDFFFGTGDILEQANTLLQRFIDYIFSFFR
jgi:hypothetical protein